MKHLDLFSGIGGFALATEMVWENVEHIFCEIDPFCQTVLKKHWPRSKIYEDIKKLRGIGTVELVTGGFPCQPFSVAGKQKGKDDDRDLWPEMFRVIKETKPTWIIGENVAGFVNMELERSIFDLESENYEVQSFIIPACAVEAPHRRDRVWIVAHTNVNRESAFSVDEESLQRQLASDSINERCQRSFSKTVQRQSRKSRQLTRSYQGWRAGWKISKPRTVGVDDGIPNRTHRIKSLGNAIVPQVAAEIMKVIKAVDAPL